MGVNGGVAVSDGPVHENISLQLPTLPTPLTHLSNSILKSNLGRELVMCKIRKEKGV